MRGRLVPPEVPLYRSRAEQFDEMVLDAVSRLEPRWESELSGVEFAVQEVPEATDLTEDRQVVPLAQLVQGVEDTGNPFRPAIPARIVVYRRPLLARAEDDEELSELVFGVIVEEFADFLGVDPEEVDPGFPGTE
jgi:predicted Zn-dependent protease with MMP-like domain